MLLKHNWPSTTNTYRQKRRFPANFLPLPIVQIPHLSKIDNQCHQFRRVAVVELCLNK
jgi:hypothetical protein